MKIVSYNIQYGKGKDGRFDLARIADAVRDADIIGLQEVTRCFPGVPEALSDQPERLAELLPGHFATYAAPLDLDAGSGLVDGRAVSRRLQFGNLLLSRWPIRSTRHLLLPRSRSFDHGDAQNGLLEAIVAAPGGDVRVYVTHLNHLRSQQRRAQLDWMLPMLHAVPAQGASLTGRSRWLPHPAAEVPAEFVLMGDFNLAPAHAEYARIVGEPDYYYGRQRTAGHLVDSWVAAGHPENDGLTWFDESTGFTQGLRLDYLFVTPGLADRVRAAWIDADNPGSDHQPVGVELDL